jgi:hypothetical protein
LDAEQSKVSPIVQEIAMAYLRGDRDGLRLLSDPDRLETTPAKTWQRARVDLVQPCGIVGNDTLAFAWLQVVYETPSALGIKPLLVVLRKTDPHWRWQILAVSQDPLSTGTFFRELPLLSVRSQVAGFPQAATLLGPPPGVYPVPPAGERFGLFRWRCSDVGHRDWCQHGRLQSSERGCAATVAVSRSQSANDASGSSECHF